LYLNAEEEVEPGLLHCAVLELCFAQGVDMGHEVADVNLQFAQHCLLRFSKALGLNFNHLAVHFFPIAGVQAKGQYAAKEDQSLQLLKLEGLPLLRHVPLGELLAKDADDCFRLQPTPALAAQGSLQVLAARQRQ
jgi:hypothetical protein